MAVVGQYFVSFVAGCYFGCYPRFFSLSVPFLGVVFPEVLSLLVRFCCDVFMLVFEFVLLLFCSFWRSLGFILSVSSHSLAVIVIVSVPLDLVLWFMLICISGSPESQNRVDSEMELVPF